MITGELKTKIDRVWDAFWSGGISNPLEVIEQITYLLFIKRLDEIETRERKKAERFPNAQVTLRFGPDQEELRWSYFKDLDSETMFKTVAHKVFPYLQQLGSDGSTYSHHMRDARFTIPSAALLSRVVDMIDQIPMEDRDTKGDLYEYMLSKIATAGHNGQFRTSRHIIQLMVEMMAPTPTDEICDPACGTAGFLVEAGEYVRRVYPNALLDVKQRAHFHKSMFYGFDFDGMMLRIGSMNMLLHGIENPVIHYRDSLAENVSDESDKYSLILANPPFKGSLDYESTSKDLQQIVKTKQTELLFLALFLRLLKPGGRAAVIVPDGVLSGPSRAHKELRRILVEDHKLDGVVKLPSGTFRPYSGVSTAILLFTKTNSGGTDNVWFYEVTADGWSLDDKRVPLLPAEKLGPLPDMALAEEEHAKNNLPDALARWFQRDGDELQRARTEQSFCVPKADIVEKSYNLSLNQYKEIVHEKVEYRAPLAILMDLERLESDIGQGISNLKAMFG
ncbi:N-6 DNA methylase [Micromonospora echinospora]|uniref:type I restriction-modification system subunit M n=1 Tax=Micromonospora echinospora TaxID=1877 RepID=UPI0037961C8B